MAAIAPLPEFPREDDTSGIPSSLQKAAGDVTDTQSDVRSLSENANIDEPVSSPAMPEPEGRPATAPVGAGAERDANNDMAIALGDLFRVLLTSKHHKDLTLAQTFDLLRPAIESRQFAVAGRMSQTRTTDAQSRARHVPQAAIIWALVSSEQADQLMQTPANEVHWNALGWSAGDVVWIVDAIGNAKLLTLLEEQLRTSIWRGKDVRKRTQ